MQRKNKSVKSRNKVHMLDMDLREILREHALRYLPAKTLCRSLTVCRDWRFQISSPFFTHNQSVCCRSLAGLFVQSQGSPPAFFSLDQMAYGVPDQELKFLPEPVDVRASSNGLLCCLGRGADRAYYVCNPVNQQWKKLPKPSADHGSDPGLALVFEPSPLNFVADYKLVCVFASTDIEGAYEFEIYSSVKDAWKVSAEMYFANASHTRKSFQFGTMIYVDGVVYWSITSTKILYFDMKTEKAAEMPRYGYGHGGYESSSSLGTMDGKLCMTSVVDQRVNVSVIQSRHSNTMSSHTARAASTKSHSFTLKFEDLTVLKSGRPRSLLTWDGIVMVQAGSKFFWYDIKTKETKAFAQDARNLDAQPLVIPYVNSLVSLT